MRDALLIAGAYLVGAIPFGLLLARAFGGVDPRTQGSGNIGATNVARTSGKKLGVATLLLDAAKGAAAIGVARWMEADPRVVAGAGFAAVAGHCFPVYLLFRGGKGVATAAGVFFALAPAVAGVAAGVFAVVAAIGRVVSVASLLATLALCLAAFTLDRRPEVGILAIALTALIFLRHTGNLRRLLRREETGL